MEVILRSLLKNALLKINNSLNLSIIVLTFNEELHIERCIKSIQQVVDQVFIVDSNSTDLTVEIAEKYNASVFQHDFINQSQQFNWALNNLPIKTDWVLRLDADEYLTDELIEEIKQKLPLLDDSVTGVVFKRRHFFLGKWIKRGTYPVKLLRLFRYGKAVCEERWMDEHIITTEGKTIEFEHDFVDHNLNNLSWWSQKHIGYAIREAVDLLDIEYNLTNTENQGFLNTQAQLKRNRKIKYAKQPLFVRSFFYFIYRYIFKLGFLEGKAGFLWHFLQGWWYRTLVDVKVYEIKRVCEGNTKKIRLYLHSMYGIKL